MNMPKHQPSPELILKADNVMPLSSLNVAHCF